MAEQADVVADAVAEQEIPPRRGLAGMSWPNALARAAPADTTDSNNANIASRLIVAPSFRLRQLARGVDPERDRHWIVGRLAKGRARVKR